MRYFLSVLLFFVFFVVVCHGTDSNFTFIDSKEHSVRAVSINEDVVSGEENLRELLKKNSLFFRLSMKKNGGKMYYGNVGQHYYDDEKVHRVNGSFNASFGFLEIVNYNITDDMLYFAAQINFFKEYGSPGYREYPYPEIYDVKLTKDDVLGILETDEYFIDEIYMNEEIKEHGYFNSDFSEIVLENDQVFLMGDNRVHSLDSRVVGPFKISSIKAKEILILWPFENGKVVK